MLIPLPPEDWRPPSSRAAACWWRGWRRPWTSSWGWPWGRGRGSSAGGAWGRSRAGGRGRPSGAGGRRGADTRTSQGRRGADSWVGRCALVTSEFDSVSTFYNECYLVAWLLQEFSVKCWKFICIFLSGLLRSINKTSSSISDKRSTEEKW